MAAFCIVNQCSDAALNSDLGQQIAGALQVQCNRDVATYWGGNYRVRWATPDNLPAPGEVVAMVLDDLPGSPGALADHNWQGVPDIYLARNMCVSLTSSAFSLSQGLSHEIIETIGDWACNLWADDDAGTEWAVELCDAVESGFYTINAQGPGQPIDVSDFLLPAFFHPGDPAGPYSYLQAAPAPFTTAVGGYQVQRTSGTGEQQVTAKGLLEHRMAKKRHWSSRTYRRGARVT